MLNILKYFFTISLAILFLSSTAVLAANYYLGPTVGSDESYNLNDPEVMEYDYEYIGYEGKGTFTQTGGINTVNNDLYLGYESNGGGIYELSGTGQLSADYEYIGLNGEGIFTHTGGTNSVRSCIYIGLYPVLGGSINNSYGVYNMNGGSLTCGGLAVGIDGHGEFHINDASSEITIMSGSLTFWEDSLFTAAPGSTIHLNNSYSVGNQSKNPEALSGFENLTLIFDNSALIYQEFDVMGQDYGASLDGFDTNFNIDKFILGDNDVSGFVRLRDIHDNGGRDGIGGYSEAQYLNELTVGTGSFIEMRGINLYTKVVDIDPDAVIDLGGAARFGVLGDVESLLDSLIGTALIDTTLVGSEYLDAIYNPTTGWTTVQAVPEPTTIALLGLGGLAMILRRNKHS